MLIATLFIIAKTWKESKCPKTKEWINILCMEWNTMHQ
jgi:hypothetical protein